MTSYRQKSTLLIHCYMFSRQSLTLGYDWATGEFQRGPTKNNANRSMCMKYTHTHTYIQRHTSDRTWPAARDENTMKRWRTLFCWRQRKTHWRWMNVSLSRHSWMTTIWQLYRLQMVTDCNTQTHHIAGFNNYSQFTTHPRMLTGQPTSNACQKGTACRRPALPGHRST